MIGSRKENWRALAEVCTVETVPVLLAKILVLVSLLLFRFEMHAFYTLQMQSFSEPRRLEPMRSLSEPKRDEEYVISCWCLFMVELSWNICIKLNNDIENGSRWRKIWRASWSCIDRQRQRFAASFSYYEYFGTLDKGVCSGRKTDTRYPVRVGVGLALGLALRMAVSKIKKGTSVDWALSIIRN